MADIQTKTGALKRVKKKIIRVFALFFGAILLVVIIVTAIIKSVQYGFEALVDWIHSGYEWIVDGVTGDELSFTRQRIADANSISKNTGINVTDLLIDTDLNICINNALGSDNTDVTTGFYASAFNLENTKTIIGTACYGANEILTHLRYETTYTRDFSLDKAIEVMVSANEELVENTKNFNHPDVLRRLTGEAQEPVFVTAIPDYDKKKKSTISTKTNADKTTTVTYSHDVLTDNEWYYTTEEYTFDMATYEKYAQEIFDDKDIDSLLGMTPYEIHCYMELKGKEQYSFEEKYYIASALAMWFERYQDEYGYNPLAEYVMTNDMGYTTGTIAQTYTSTVSGKRHMVSECNISVNRAKILTDKDGYNFYDTSVGEDESIKNAVVSITFGYTGNYATLSHDAIINQFGVPWQTIYALCTIQAMEAGATTQEKESVTLQDGTEIPLGDMVSFPLDEDFLKKLVDISRNAVTEVADNGITDMNDFADGTVGGIGGQTNTNGYENRMANPITAAQTRDCTHVCDKTYKNCDGDRLTIERNMPTYAVASIESPVADVTYNNNGTLVTSLKGTSKFEDYWEEVSKLIYGEDSEQLVDFDLYSELLSSLPKGEDIVRYQNDLKDHSSFTIDIKDITLSSYISDYKDADQKEDLTTNSGQAGGGNHLINGEVGSNILAPYEMIGAESNWDKFPFNYTYSSPGGQIQIDYLSKSECVQIAESDIYTILNGLSDSYEGFTENTTTYKMINTALHSVGKIAYMNSPRQYQGSAVADGSISRNITWNTDRSMYESLLDSIGYINYTLYPRAGTSSSDGNVVDGVIEFADMDVAGNEVQIGGDDAIKNINVYSADCTSYVTWLVYAVSGRELTVGGNSAITTGTWGDLIKDNPTIINLGQASVAEMQPGDILIKHHTTDRDNPYHALIFVGWLDEKFAMCIDCEGSYRYDELHNVVSYNNDYSFLRAGQIYGTTTYRMTAKDDYLACCSAYRIKF